MSTQKQLMEASLTYDTPRDPKRFVERRTSAYGGGCEDSKLDKIAGMIFEEGYYSSMQERSYSVKLIYIWISKPEVMRSGAGYYVGSSYWSPEWGGMIGPYDRGSPYFDTKAEAEDYLEQLA